MWDVWKVEAMDGDALAEAECGHLYAVTVVADSADDAISVARETCGIPDFVPLEAGPDA